MSAHRCSGAGATLSAPGGLERRGKQNEFNGAAGVAHCQPARRGHGEGRGKRGGRQRCRLRRPLCARARDIGEGAWGRTWRVSTPAWELSREAGNTFRFRQVLSSSAAFTANIGYNPAFILGRGDRGGCKVGRLVQYDKSYFVQVLSKYSFYNPGGDGCVSDARERRLSEGRCAGHLMSPPHIASRHIGPQPILETASARRW